MKKIFIGIGLLLGVFSVFFFLLIADKDVYFNDKPVYNISLSKNITGEMLNQIAVEEDVMIRLVKFKDISFGNNHLDVTIINPDSNIELGRQPSVFPNNKIVYSIYSKGPVDKKIKYFTIQTDDLSKIENLQQKLMSRGFETGIEQSTPSNFGFSALFSVLNLKFFLLLTILIFFSISTYYVHRLKEIGIKKLHGWKSLKISLSLLLRLSLYSYGSSLFLIFPFIIYIFVTDLKMLNTYVTMCLYLYFFLAIVFIISSLVGAIYIYQANQVSAIKNKKNNKMLFYILLIFKGVIVTLLTLSLNNSIDDVNKFNSALESIKKLEKNDFYKVQTASAPEETVHNYLDNYIAELRDEDIYNYSPPDNTININQIEDLKSNDVPNDIESIAFTMVSKNLLDVIKVKDSTGEMIQSSGIEENTLLVPQHYTGDLKLILDYLGLSENLQIHYIKNNQIQENLLWPGSYIFDSVIYVRPLQKSLYLNSGEILFNKSSANLLKNELKSNGFDSNSIDIQSMNNEYNLAKSNLTLTIVESSFHVVITILSFFLCIVSIATIFLELRKKELAVFRLLGKKPNLLIGKFLVLNALITVIIALVINWTFISLFFVEIIIFTILINQYFNKKAILSIKGE